MPTESDIRGLLQTRIPLDRDQILQIASGDDRVLDADWIRSQPRARVTVLKMTDAAFEVPLATLPMADFGAVVIETALGRLHRPDAFLAALKLRTAPDAVCVAGVMNAGHWRRLQNRMNGVSTDDDRTVGFTRKSAVDLFRSAGWTVLDITPQIIETDETEAALAAFAKTGDALGVPTQTLRDSLSPVGWVVRAVHGPVATPVTVAALGMKKIGGVTEARVDHPMAALASLPGVRAVWGAGTVNLPRSWPPGVFVLQRQFLDGGDMNAVVQRMIGRGWIIVSEIDDDPHHWPQYVASDFHAFRGVHAVTTSTEALADTIRQWNPNVTVFANAINRLPTVSATTPKQGERLRVFFGALNRQGDWVALIDALNAAAETLADQVEFVVIHDRAFFDALPDGAKTFHPTLPHDAYMALMASCDVGLLPLADTPFNRLKSDLKLIECCAAGVVPLCSPTLYAEVPEHRDIAVFADTPEEWRDTLIALCRDPDDIRRRRRLGLDYVAARRMHAHQVGAREAYYRDLVTRQPELEQQRLARLASRRG